MHALPAPSPYAHSGSLNRASEGHELRIVEEWFRRNGGKSVLGPYTLFGGSGETGENEAVDVPGTSEHQGLKSRS